MEKMVIKEKIQYWFDKGWKLKEYSFTEKGIEYKTNGECFLKSGRLVYVIVT
jgi:hypothetical protein